MFRFRQSSLFVGFFLRLSVYLIYMKQTFSFFIFFFFRLLFRFVFSLSSVVVVWFKKHILCLKHRIWYISMLLSAIEVFWLKHWWSAMMADVITKTSMADLKSITMIMVNQVKRLYWWNYILREFDLESRQIRRVYRCFKTMSESTICSKEITSCSLISF